MHNCFKDLDLLASEIAELPSAKVVDLWHEMVIYPASRVPDPYYPDVEYLLLEIVGEHARRLDAEGMSFKYLFEWIREIQGYLLDNKLDVPTLPPESLRPLVEALRHATISCGRIDPGTEREWYSRDMTWAMVVERWQAVKHPAGHNAFDLASERAKRCPIALNRERFGAHYTDLLVWVASIGYYLQVSLGDVDIMIPVELIGRAIGYQDSELARKAGSRLLKPLKLLGLLIEKPGFVPCSRAARYRFDLRKKDLFTPPTQ